MLNREQFIEDIANSIVNSIELEDLIKYFKDKQIEYMENLSDLELLRHADIYLQEFNQKDYQNEK